MSNDRPAFATDEAPVLRLPQLRFTVRRMMVAVAIVAVLCAVLPFVWAIVTLDFVDDAYAQWGAGDLVVEYLKEHEDRWPGGWKDLAPYFATGGGKDHGFSLAEYRRRIGIDWSADVADLEARAKSSQRATFRVISARNWTASVFSGHEPNDILYRYFNTRHVH